MSRDDVVSLSDRRERRAKVCLMTMPPPVEQQAGPFTVTVSDSKGKMFEVVFPDYTGVLPEDAGILATVGCYELLANLLTGAMRVYLGAK